MLCLSASSAKRTIATTSMADGGLATRTRSTHLALLVMSRSLIASGWRGMKVGPGNTVAKRLECEASAPRYYVFDMTTCTDAESDLRTALGAEDEYEREMATRSLTDQCVLGDIATFDKHYLVRIAATERLTDPGLLADIAEDDEEEFVREAATERLQEIAAADADSGDALPAPGM